MAVQFKDWVFTNIKWIITLVVIGISNYFVLANKIDGNTTKINDTAKRVDKIEIWKEEASKAQIIKDNINNKQMHEIQLNLKILMEKNGLKYQSITE